MLECVNKKKMQFIGLHTRSMCAFTSPVLVRSSYVNVIEETSEATVTPDRTISGSYDWLRVGQGATDRQFLLRSPAAVAYRDRSLSVVALSRTIGEYRSQEPSQDIVRLVVAINDRCTINRDGRRPIVRAIVAYCDRS